MGLLNDAKSRKKISAILIVHYQKVIVLSFITGILWFVLLASDAFNNKTYFSENALLPSLVVREFNPGSSLNRISGSLKDEAKIYSSTIPCTWIQAQFRQLGLDVYQHNFSLRYPFGSNSVHFGKNLYAILRAPKVASTEALILSAPYRSLDSIHDSTFSSIALMVELAKAFRNHAYWSKDIIFLITEHEMIGFQAWLEAYHKVGTSEFIASEELIGNSGLIQGVINLEISGDAISYIDIKIEGLNGQLPNLDLFNLVIELCNREMVTTSFHAQFNFFPSSLTWNSWQHNFATMVAMMSIQATGLPTGGHGLFHRYGIQAITLTSKAIKRDGHRAISLTQIGKVLEGIFRSLNNLLEKFHQSFFFYLLPGTRSYISIGSYMPPFAMIAAPILIKALYLYLSFQSTASRQEACSSESKLSLWAALDIVAINHLFGALMYLFPMYVDYFKEYTNFSLEDSFYKMHLIFICLWFLFIYCYNQQYKLSADQYTVKMCVVLLELGALLYTVSLVNISLATIIGVVYVPVSVSLQYRGRLSFLQYLFLLIINPFVTTYLIIVAQSYFADVKAIWWIHFVRALTGHKKVVMYTVEDLYFFGNWNYQIATLVLLPLWFELWALKTMKLA